MLLSYGIRDFEITGGEPSECARLREYCEYIKEKSPSSKIAIITNGGLFASETVELAKLNRKLLRVNIVVGTFNVLALDSIIDDVIGFEPAIVNFLPVNLFDGAKSQYG